VARVPLLLERESPLPDWIEGSSRARGALGLPDLDDEHIYLDPERDFLVGGSMARRREAVVGDEGFRRVRPCAGVGTVAEDYEFSRGLARQGGAAYVPGAAARHLVPRSKARLEHARAPTQRRQVRRREASGRGHSAAQELRGPFEPGPDGAHVEPGLSVILPTRGDHPWHIEACLWLLAELRPALLAGVHPAQNRPVRSRHEMVAVDASSRGLRDRRGGGGVRHEV